MNLHDEYKSIGSRELAERDYDDVYDLYKLTATVHKQNSALGS